MKEDWFLNILHEMVKNKYTIVNLHNMRIEREKSNLTEFVFTIYTSKKLFEDILTDEEKSMLWLGSDMSVKD